jgi:DNA repair protein RecN (Recombination protein N)
VLIHLHIKDLAVVRSVELGLGSGMSALTGETGAGKSILIDALGLALGDRADNAMIRAGCQRAEITAVFDAADRDEVAAWLSEHTLDDAGECILRRVLVRDGRSRAFINGSPVPVQSLQELGQRLVDIHGQHAHQSLLRRPYQRRLLDEYAGHQALAGSAAELYHKYHKARSRMTELQEASRDRAAKLDLLSYQAQELEALNLGEHELEELDQQHARLSNTGRLQQVCAQIIETLYESETSVQDQLLRAARDLGDLASIDATLSEPGALLDNALIQLQEASSGLRGYLDGLELDPTLLHQLEERIGQVHDLARKYRVEAKQLPGCLADISQDLAKLENADLQLDNLKQEVDALLSEFLSRAAELSRARAIAAEKLAETVTATLQTLGMASGRFSIELLRLEADDATPGGLDRIEFMVSANPGHPLQPLAKVASGGELSRISLAIQVATARCGRIPTLIFDEVDVGIGGGIAEVVGQMLRELGNLRQVLCVTHLPQVAAMGHHHLQVTKQQTHRQAHIGIATLAEEQRVTEIARMLGGVDITDHTLAHAREMVEHSQEA